MSERHPLNFSLRRAFFGLVVAILILFAVTQMLDAVRLFLVPDRNIYEEHFLSGTIAPLAAMISIAIALAWYVFLGTKWIFWSFVSAIFPGVAAALLAYIKNPELYDWLGLGIVSVVVSAATVAVFWLVMIANEHLRGGS